MNNQVVRISPYSAQYTIFDKGEAEHVREVVELVCDKRPAPEIADEFIELHRGQRNPTSAALKARGALNDQER